MDLKYTRFSTFIFSFCLAVVSQIVSALDKIYQVVLTISKLVKSKTILTNLLVTEDEWWLPRQVKTNLTKKLRLVCQIIQGEQLSTKFLTEWSLKTC